MRSHTSGIWYPYTAYIYRAEQAREHTRLGRFFELLISKNQGGTDTEKGGSRKIFYRDPTLPVIEKTGIKIRPGWLLLNRSIHCHIRELSRFSPSVFAPQHARQHTASDRFPRRLCRRWGECKRRAMSLWKHLDAVFPKTPFSLSVSPSFSRKPVR